MTWEILVTIVGWSLILLGGAYKSGKITAMFEEVYKNHLPYIYEEFRYLRERIDKL